MDTLKQTASSGFSFVRYDGLRKGEWDRFVESSLNATFLFFRDYMDYHADRFIDCSLMAYHNGKLRACLPANLESDGVLNSHGGLTYGGWILPRNHFDGEKVRCLFEAWISWARERGIASINYKPVPWVMAPMPAQEDLFALWKTGFTLTRRMLSSALYPDCNPGLNMAKRQQLREAVKNGKIRVAESWDMRKFYLMLSECLSQRHDARPVHSLEELTLLHSRFPKNIRLFLASDESDGDALAGVLVYDTGFTAHAQYMASTSRGREARALTYLVHQLVNGTFSARRLFDFGTSNLPDASLHESLLSQKYSLGGRGAVYETYSIKL